MTSGVPVTASGVARCATTNKGGVASLLRLSHTHLLQVPCAATVYCQPIQMRCSNALGFNVEQTNQWRWRPDYEGLDLAGNR